MIPQVRECRISRLGRPIRTFHFTLSKGCETAILEDNPQVGQVDKSSWPLGQHGRNGADHSRNPVERGIFAHSRSSASACRAFASRRLTVDGFTPNNRAASAAVFSPVPTRRTI